MKRAINLIALLIKGITVFAILFAFLSCDQQESKREEKQDKKIVKKVYKESETPEFFQLRPEVEKAYGYSHAVKIGNEITISGAVSMDDQGNPTAVGDLEQQMKNCYADLEKILTHFGCTFDDVVVENVFTTNMPLFLEKAGYRNTIYTKQFPAGSWLGVKELAVPEFLIEIELEVYKRDIPKEKRDRSRSKVEE